jgi:cytochrome c oxidase accessory protein FixG
LLAAVTSLAGRVYCGFFCFQTVWTDVFTWIEEKLEGPPHKRAKLEQAPWTFTKYRIKITKHFLFLVISVLTGVSFTLWFGDAYELWGEYLTLSAPLIAWDTVAVFTFFTYLFAGYMREQVCFWLCPYARIQGVMVDKETVLPTYDFSRGEPRGKLKKGEDAQFGDCIDCKQCVAVCPTGIDIRHGQQEGCITCALCLDACDAVMDKVDRPRGLIRYASLNEIQGVPSKALFKRPRVLVYLTIMLAAMGGIVYGLSSLASLELKVLHERQPLFVMQSDGSVQNKYQLKILNKTDRDMQVSVSVSGHDALKVIGANNPFNVPADKVAAFTIFVRIPGDQLTGERMPIFIKAVDAADPQYSADYKSMFFGPPH